MTLLHAAIAANRFGLGAAPGQLDAIKGDPKGWLLSQLTPEKELPAPLNELPSTGEDAIAFAMWTASARAANPQAGQAGAATAPNAMNTARPGAGMGAQLPGAQRPEATPPAGGDMAGMSVEASFGRTLIPRYRRAMKARFDAAVQSTTPFRERLIHFWSNHFVVSSAKASAIALPPSFERDVARSHVAGRFVDMLTASSKHTAMLFYLDNSYSIGPNSEWGKNPDLVPFVSPVIGRPKGLNENLGREILELHTLGVNGGYTQDDVRNFAKVITGWGYDINGRRANPGALKTATAADLFYFNARAHEPGPQTVLGRVYSQDGVAAGEAVLRDLAAHPSTAKFVALKLCRYFIADEPPPTAVARVAAAFSASGGDLVKTVSALVESPEAWEQPLAKMKQPEEYLISAVRAVPSIKLEAADLHATLNQMGQQPYYQPGPDGWKDNASEWSGPDALWKRLEWSVAKGESYATAGTDPAALAQDVLGPVISQSTLSEIRRAESPAQGLAMLLVSPEFLRR